ncbi:MAG: COX15/CtaA family protein [Bacteroidota bacterium]|nr:COX15/CtaA family protein [Bacteroidota bacterium]
MFSRVSLAVLLLTFTVILAGGIVRTTGSGMGCPDWPTCFGQYIPPTDVRQLPPNYKAIFQVQGKEIADFDAFKTWVEYINRLLGALLGLVILVMLVYSLRFRKQDVWLPLLSLAICIVTGFVGWLGSVVVASDLEPAKVTIHMLSSAVIVALAVSIRHRALKMPMPNHTVGECAEKRDKYMRRLRIVIVVCVILTVTQILLGTQVREQVDLIDKRLEGRWREQWIDGVGAIFLVHRSMSWIILAANGTAIWLMLRLHALRQEREASTYHVYGIAIGMIIFAEIIAGVVMNYCAIPRTAQPIHLVLAMMLLAIQWKMLLTVNKSAARRV